MEFTGIGGGVMVAIAAALWLAYLVPTWFKRREYLATERNAVRLQQTIRVLAETAEIPAEVRADAAARRIAQAQRAELLRGPVAVGRPVSRPAPQPDPRIAILRTRRARAMASLMLLVSLVFGVVQVGFIATTGAELGSWVVLGIAAVVGMVSFSTLARLARAARTRARAEVRPARRTSLGARPAVPVRTAQPEWTPVAVPRPLYLSRTEAPAAPVVDAAFELEIAAAAAVRLQREKLQTTPSFAPKPAASSSPFASMGIVDDASRTAPDLDAALARRRA